MKMMNTLIYLAVMFYLGTGAVVDTEPKISEDGIAEARIALEEMIEKLETDGMVPDKKADIDTSNEELITDVSGNDLQNVERMGCHWRGNNGRCCVRIRHIPSFCISMYVGRGAITFRLTVGRRTLMTRTYRGKFSKTFYVRIGILKVGLRISVVSFTAHSVRICFGISYRIFFHHRSQNLGCTTKRFLSNENIPLDVMDDVMMNANSFLASQGIDAEKLSSLEYIDEENQSENPLVWKMNA
ncbi:uncharacterized protein LOC106872507 [Octopus bimaculoides]|uniref:Uncharacterized protein n=1 Tax=Octopus bimaculoides TaxID=37653 RepID=A0A0L8H7X4_OCTBM|nr:uncharacterized protein LOC106872507 [Octopus bimaculoides]|eukprot:XP_014775010.1 PREDICTED: uncharacterized protein LOC106872507 [Octopus bimaculoides]